MALRELATILAASALGQSRRKQVGRRVAPGWERWISEPRSAVLFVLATVFVIGGGRKLLLARKARGAIGRLEGGDINAESIAAAADHGRTGLMELFRLLGTAESETLRDAAGHALSVLWARDEMIAEEEKALVRRGFRVDWRARRRYPRALRAEIPIGVDFGVPFLRDDGPGVGPKHLEWSYRIVGARRAMLETFTPRTAGLSHAKFSLVPSDFDTNGPHKLAFHARVRTVGLTESWEIELPLMPFSFEFDPQLSLEALFALPDESRGATLAERVRLVKAEVESADVSAGSDYLPLSSEMAIRHVPVIEVRTPLTCDLAHKIELEIAGVPGSYSAGELILSGQGGGEGSDDSQVRHFPLGPVVRIPAGAIDRTGVHSIRARLTADSDRGWSDPGIRSIWPETITTDWLDVEVIRL